MPSTRILTAPALLLVLVALAPAAANTSPLSGDGSSGTPYLVEDATDLVLVASSGDGVASGWDGRVRT